MIGINNRVRIAPSEDLAGMRLSGLAGRCGVVVEQVSGARGGLIGYMVFLDTSFQGELLWFVPEDAAEHEDVRD